MSPAARFPKMFLLLGVALVIGAAAPQGGEYPISGPLPGDQTAPSVAIGASGGWVAWQDNSLSKSTLNVAARRLDANLNPISSSFRVNKGAVGDHEKPQVAMLGNGGAVVVWQGGKLGFQDIYARFLNADGTFATSDLLVSRPTGTAVVRVTTNVMVMRNNKLTNRSQRLRNSYVSKVERPGGAAVATLSDGSVVVAYASARKVTSRVQTLGERVRHMGRRDVTNTVVITTNGTEDNGQDVYLQRFSATGQKLGEEIRANQFTTFNQRSPAVAARPDGTFVVAWVSELHGKSTDPAAVIAATGSATNAMPLLHDLDIVARVFGNDGTAAGDEQVVNTTGAPCNTPTVSANTGGGFTVAWTRKGTPHQESLDIYARAFNAAGSPTGDEFVVNSFVYGDQFNPRIASTTGGEIVVWTSLAQDGSREGVFGRWLSGGAVAGDEFRVNTTTLLRQFHPAVAAESGRALAVWSSYQTEAACDVYGQRYVSQ